MSIGIVSILFLLGIVILFNYAEPINYIKRKLGFFEDKDGVLNTLLYCSFCNGFWISLIIAQSFQMACIIALFIWLIENKI